MSVICTCFVETSAKKTKSADSHVFFRVVVPGWGVSKKKKKRASAHGPGLAAHQLPLFPSPPSLYWVFAVKKKKKPRRLTNNFCRKCSEREREQQFREVVRDKCSLFSIRAKPFTLRLGGVFIWRGAISSRLVFGAALWDPIKMTDYILSPRDLSFGEDLQGCTR